MRNGLNRIQNVVLIGSSSEIGMSIIRQLPISSDSRLTLIGRRGAELSKSSIPFSKFDFVELDLLTRFDAGAISRSIFSNSDIDVVVFAAGVLTPQEEMSSDEKVESLFITNAVSQIRLLSALASRMKAQRHGHLLVVSSIAAVRPRSSNFLYGSSKVALDFFARGLRRQLMSHSVVVSILRPGFVKTKMTLGLNPAPFATDANEVGRIGVAGLISNREIIYAPKVLKYVAWFLIFLPQFIIDKLDS